MNNRQEFEKAAHVIKVNTASIFLVVARVMEFGNEYY